MLARYMLSSCVRLSVCLSVCPSSEKTDLAPVPPRGELDET